MGEELGTDPCRVTVIGPARTLELAIPANLPLIDVLPVMVEHLGGEGDSFAQAVAGRGVALQRLGGEPLDEDQSAEGLGLRDGDLLCLRLRDSMLPAFACDDAIDGVAARLRRRGDSWTPGLTRGVLLALAGTAFAVSLAALLPGPAPAARAISALVLAVVLLGASCGAGRGLGDRGAGGLLVGAAAAFAALAAHLLPQAAADPGTTASADVRFTAAAAAASAVGMLGVWAVGLPGAWNLAVGITGLAASAGGLLCQWWDLDPAGAASVVVTAVLLLSPTLPSAVFRLGGLRLPDLPLGPQDIQKDITPYPDGQIRAGADAVRDHLLAAHVAVGIVTGVALVLVCRGDGWATTVLAVLGCGLLLARFRTLADRRQRLALLVPAVAGLVALVLTLGLEASPRTRAVTLAPYTAVLAAGFLAATRLRQPRRPRPYWGRAAQLAETTLAVALVPVLVQVLGLYGWVRGLAG
jgi:type VII secretion integral membrane protein EccD